MSEVKLCVDCKHYHLGFTKNPEFSKCDLKVDLVTGAPDTYCCNQRKFSVLCGEEGKYFEAKPQKESFWKRIMNILSFKN